MIFASLESLDLVEIRIELQAGANFELGLHCKVIVFTQVETSTCNTECCEDQLLKTFESKEH